MPQLCPECAHRLYGYPNCDHDFVDGRCRLCRWDGSVSNYLYRSRSKDGPRTMKIVCGDLDDPRVQALLERHVETAHAETAAGSAHALDRESLRSADVIFWSAWDDDMPVGVGALKRLSPTHGEIKSMHTVREFRRKGVGTTLLRHIVRNALALGMDRLSLETGSWAHFEPARALYRRYGFVECAPFGEYSDDLNSIFMTLDLSRLSPAGQFDFGELERSVREYNLDPENPREYDFNGVVHLMLAALDNLRERALEGELGDIGYSMNDEQREFLQKIAAYASRPTDGMIEAEED